MRRTTAFTVGLAGATVILASIALGTVQGANKIDTAALRAAVTIDGVRAHQEAIQDIADNNGNVRSAGTAGYDLSAAYVAQQLSAAGYSVTIQEFEFLSTGTVGPSALEQTAPGAEIYVEEVDFNVMSETEPGDVNAPVTGANLALAIAADVLDRDEDLVVRGQAVATLGKIGGDQATRLLNGALADIDPAVRGQAIRALGAEGGDQTSRPG